MSDIYLNPLTGDINLDNNRLTITKRIEELARQKLYITISTFKGEWFANRFYGVPYLINDYNNVQLLEKNTKDLLDLEIKSAILNTEGISQILQYSSVLDDNRSLSVSFIAVTESGVEITITDLPII